MKTYNFKRALCSAVSLLLSAAIAASLSSCGKRTIAMSCGDTEITEGMYSYWLSAYKTNFVYTYGGGSDNSTLWTATAADGQSYADYAEDKILTTVRNFAIAVEQFRVLGLKIDSSISEQVNADISEKLEYAGSRPALNSDLSRYGINIDGLKDIYIAEEKWQAVYNYYFGTSGIERLSDEELTAYYKSNYSLLGLVVLYTENKAERDENGTYVYDKDGNITVSEMTAEEKAAKQATAADVYERLKNGENWSELASEYSDADMSYYTNGCFVSSAEADSYGADLVSAAAEMTVGEIRRIDTDAITYLAVKLALPELGSLDESDNEQLGDLRDDASRERYTEKFDALADTVTVNTDIIKAHPIEDAPLNLYY